MLTCEFTILSRVWYQIHDKGKTVIVGSHETMEENNIPLPEGVKIKGRATWVAFDAEIAGVFDIQYELRQSAISIGKQLHHQ